MIVMSRQRLLAFQTCLWLLTVLLPLPSNGFSIYCGGSCQKRTAPSVLSSLYLLDASSSSSMSTPSEEEDNDDGVEGHSQELILPDIEQLSTAPFMKQVQFGMELTSALRDNQPTQQLQTHQLLLLKDAIRAQLSHPDGIRGFMVAFLTAEDDDDDNARPIPPVVLDALRDQLTARDDDDDDDDDSGRNNKDLVPLMCMNVVMPTAMITMHRDEGQSASSARTARRGKQLLMDLIDSTSSGRNDGIAEINDHVTAIQAVATADAVPGNENGTKNDGETELSGCSSTSSSTSKNGRLVEYWTDFFDKWGYGPTQRADVANVMIEISRKVTT